MSRLLVFDVHASHGKSQRVVISISTTDTRQSIWLFMHGFS